MKYKIISSDCQSTLGIFVEDCANNGWKPQGGVFVIKSNNSTGFIFFQAIIKDEE